MDLYKQIEEDEKELLAEEGGEDAEVDAQEEIKELEDKDEGAVEEEVEEGNAEVLEEDTKEEPEEEKEEAKVDHVAFAKMRREKAALDRQLAELKAKPVSPVHEEVKQEYNKVIPDPVLDPDGYKDWKIEQLESQVNEIKGYTEQSKASMEQQQLMGQAIQEFESYENDFRATQPDYDDAAEHYKGQLVNSIKMLNPTASKVQATEMANNQILMQASQIVQKGLDPAEEFYAMAQQAGYAQTKPDTSKVDKLNAVKANKKKSVSSLQGSGRSASSPNYTLEDVANMSPAELMKVDPNVLRELEAM